jgi:hypothetical protein
MQNQCQNESKFYQTSNFFIFIILAFPLQIQLPEELFYKGNNLPIYVY